jgi:regulatory protein
MTERRTARNIWSRRAAAPKVSLPERTITQVEPLKRPRGYSAVYVDGEPALTAPTKIVAGLGLWPGRIMRPDDLQRTIAQAQEADALAQALKLLAACDRTEMEIRRGLTRRGFPQPTIATVLDRLRDRGLIDDHRYAKEYVRTQGARRALGPAALRAKLARVGVAPSTVDAALAEEMTEASQRELAEAAARKRLSSLRKVSGVALRSRLYAFLLNRGFDYEVAAEVLEGLPETE